MYSNDFKQKFILARRKAIELDFLHLNDVQREAVMTVNGPLLILAGAGSGKTTVLISRIANLLKYGIGSDSDFIAEGIDEEQLNFLEEHLKNPTDDDKDSAYRLCAVEPVAPGSIIAITFTNKAAGEIKERLNQVVGPASDDIWAMTFHSACARILRYDINKLGYARSFTIYDTSDTTSLVKRILKDLDIDEKNLPPKTVLGYISRAKDAMISADEFYSSAEKTMDMRRKLIGQVYLHYSDHLKAADALDFDDLLLLTVRLLQDFPEVLRHYQSKFKYILVDEYQDTNNLQYILVSMLSGGHGNICVVGDDDQSIYKFRGATIENILSFERQFSNARVIRLEQNYRSTGLILDAASDVIQNNTGRKGKKLWTDKSSGEKPALYMTHNERSEAQLVADTILSSVSQGKSWQEHAVLYRMNAQSNQLETAFKRCAIPYRIVGGMGFYDRAEIKDMLAYLCVIHNPNDNLRLLRIINQPPRGIGAATVSRLVSIALELDKPIIDIIRQSHNHDSLKSAAGRLLLFADMLSDLQEHAHNCPLDELYETLIEKSGYIRMLTEKRSDENTTRLENVREMKTNILAFIKSSGGTLFDFLSETALYTDTEIEDAGTDRVLLMTMHSAKGLEFDTVFIVGAEEGVFPGNRAIGDTTEMEEERRLCYVAMTRAKRRLYFLCANERMLFGKTSSALPSRFVREIDSNNIDTFELPSTFDNYYSSFSGAFERNTGSDYTSYSKKEISPRSEKIKSQKSSFTSSEVVLNLKKGDCVEHKVFGSGFVTSISQGGGDSLLEIAFDNAGTKRMLLNSAARYLKKL